MIKKLLGIMVLGLLLCSNAYAKDVYLTCVAFNGLADRSIVFNDDTQIIIVNGKEVNADEWNERIIRWGNNSIDRITGVYGDHTCSVTSGTKF